MNIINETGITTDWESNWIELDGSKWIEIDNDADFIGDKTTFEKGLAQIEYLNSTGTLDGVLSVYSTLDGKESLVTTVALDSANNTADTTLVKGLSGNAVKFKVTVNNLTNVDLNIDMDVAN